MEKELGSVLEELAESVRERSQSNGGEKVDGVTSFSNMVLGEHFLVPFHLFGVTRLESFLQPSHAQGLGHFLHHNFEKDAARRRRLIFIQVNVRQYTPGHGIRVQQMRKKLGHVSQLVRFESVDRVVLLGKGVHKGLSPAIRQHAESSRNHAVVTLKGSLLRAAFNEHVDQFFFATSRNVHLGQLVRRLLESSGRHDGEVNLPPQMHQIRF